MNECQNDFISVIKCYDDYIFLLDNINKIIIALIEKDETKIKGLKFITSFDFHNIICFIRFGLYLQKN